MSSFSDQLRGSGGVKGLKRTTTKVTLPNGKVYFEKDGQILQEANQHSCGFVIDTQPDLQIGLVQENLLVASQDVASDPALLAQHGVTHILNLAGFPSNRLEGLSYLDVPILDLPEEVLSDHFQPCFTFIDRALEIPENKVLVHCNAGISRSVSIITAYLMSSNKWSLEKALEVVKTARPRARPNEGFMKQLKMYENQCII